MSRLIFFSISKRLIIKYFVTFVFKFSLLGLLLSCNIDKLNINNSDDEHPNDLISVEFKDNSDTFNVNDEYHFKVNTEIDKSSILVSSNNGVIKISEVKEYDFVIYPSTKGILTLRFYKNEKGLRKEIYKTDLLVN